jgi:hypothetical protein
MSNIPRIVSVDLTHLVRAALEAESRRNSSANEAEPKEPGER